MARIRIRPGTSAGVLDFGEWFECQHDGLNCCIRLTFTAAGTVERFRYNADATRTGTKKMLPIPWNFARSLGEPPRKNQNELAVEQCKVG